MIINCVLLSCFNISSLIYASNFIIIFLCVLLSNVESYVNMHVVTCFFVFCLWNRLVASTYGGQGNWLCRPFSNPAMHTSGHFWRNVDEIQIYKVGYLASLKKIETGIFHLLSVGRNAPSFSAMLKYRKDLHRIKGA